MARTSSRRRAPAGFRDINLTPLIDVMLVLLIVFMITAPLLTTHLPVDLPNVSAAPTRMHDLQRVVSITADERIVYENRDVTDEIEAMLKEDPQIVAAGSIYVRADENARYGVVARVVAAARSAGIEEISLVVEPEEG